MIVEYIRYRIAAGRTDAFVAAYRAAAESLRASPSCLGYELACCAEAPESFVLRIHWESLHAHLEGFRKSAAFGPFFEAVRPFFDDIEEMRHYQPTDLAWTRPAS